MSLRSVLRLFGWTIVYGCDKVIKIKDNSNSVNYDEKWKTQWGPARMCYGPSFYHKKRLIQKIFKKYSLKGDIVEVGCGDGSLLGQFYGSANNLYGYDISEKAIELAKSRFGDTAFFSVGDITKPDTLSEKKFDVVLCSEVLEHIENDRLAIKHLYNLLKPGGCLIMTVPHLKRYWSHLDTSDGHVRRYEKDALKDMLNGIGFVVYENFDWGYPLFHLYYERILKREKKNIMGDVSRKPVLKYFLSKILILLCYFDDLFMNSGKGRTIFMLCKKEKNKTNVLRDSHE